MRQIDFKDNDRVPSADRALIEDMRTKYVSENEETFFETVIWKEVYEWAGNCDVLLSEYDNDEGVFLVRYYDSEYDIGQWRGNVANQKGGYFDDLSEALKYDLFDLTGRHVSLLDWLRERDYAGVRYDQNREY